MLDGDVRVALHKRLAQEHADELDDTAFIDELGLCGRVRVDVAVVNGSLSGYEVKSARDTLRRLPLQVEVYSEVLDFAELVVASNHVEHARELLPAWWGVTVATQDQGQVVLRRDRPATRNPSVVPMSLVQLLWREEALDELEERGLSVGVRSKPRWDVWERLSTQMPLLELQDVVRRRLKARTSWRDGR